MNKLTALAISNDNFAFDPSTGQSFSLNKTAKVIIDLLVEKKTEEEIIKIISDNYDISEDDSFLEVSDFLSKLRVFNLLETF
jgi:hypothetical protein